MTREQLHKWVFGCLRYVTRPFAMRVCVLTTALCFSAPSLAEDNQRLKLTRTSDGLYAVETSVNGNESLPFIIDTAAAVSAIRSRLLERENLDTMNVDWTVYGLLDVDNAPMVQSANLTVGPISGPSNMAVLTDEHALADVGSAGLLGLDVLMSSTTGGRYVALDFANMELSSGDTLREVGVKRKFTWRKSSLHPTLPRMLTFDVSISGVKGVAILDTGLQFAVVNKSYVEALGKRVTFNTFNVTDVHGEQKVLDTLRAGKLKLGEELEWRNINALVTDAPVFEKLQTSDKPTVLVGANFLRNLKIVIDRKNNTYILDTPSKMRNRRICTGSAVVCPNNPVVSFVRD